MKTKIPNLLLIASCLSIVSSSLNLFFTFYYNKLDIAEKNDRIREKSIIYKFSETNDSLNNYFAGPLIEKLSMNNKKLTLCDKRNLLKNNIYNIEKKTKRDSLIISNENSNYNHTLKVRLNYGYSITGLALSILFLILALLLKNIKSFFLKFKISGSIYVMNQTSNIDSQSDKLVNKITTITIPEKIFNKINFKENVSIDEYNLVISELEKLQKEYHASINEITTLIKYDYELYLENQIKNSIINQNIKFVIESGAGKDKGISSPPITMNCYYDNNQQKLEIFSNDIHFAGDSNKYFLKPVTIVDLSNVE